MKLAAKTGGCTALLLFLVTLVSAQVTGGHKVSGSGLEHEKHLDEIHLDREQSSLLEAKSSVERAQFLLQESVRVLQGAHAVGEYANRKRKTNESRSKAVTITTKSQAIRMQVLHKNLEADYENIAGGQKTVGMMIQVISKAKKVLHRLRNGLKALGKTAESSETSRRKLLMKMRGEVVSATSSKSMGQVEKDYEASLASVLHAYHEMKVVDSRRDAATALSPVGRGNSSLKTELEEFMDRVERLQSVLKRTLSAVNARKGSSTSGGQGSFKTLKDLKHVKEKFARVKAELSQQVKKLMDSLMMTQASQRRLLDSVAELEMRMDTLKKQQADRRLRVVHLHQKSLHLQKTFSTLQPT